jgi:hypothetical protein
MPPSSIFRASALKPAYNGQVYFVPTDCWQLAVWAASRNTRFMLPRAGEEFLSQCCSPGYAPVLWYTPGGTLGGEIYKFLHCLPGIGRVLILSRAPQLGPTKLDRKNLEAMLDEHKALGQAPAFSQGKNSCHNFPLSTKRLQAGQEVPDNLDLWLGFRSRFAAVAPEQLPHPVPRVLLIMPASPQFACAVLPLAAYVQGTPVFTHPRLFTQQEMDQVADAAYSDAGLDEVWLVGPMTDHCGRIEQTLDEKREETKQFGREVKLRILPGDDPFTVAQQASLLLLVYRYLDTMLLEALANPTGRELFFAFLRSEGMRTLYHYCNRVLDLADQLRHGDYFALLDWHNLYWSLVGEERCEFVQRFQEAYPQAQVVLENLGVVADAAVVDEETTETVGTEMVPHYLIDAAAFAARRAAPLLLIKPLPAETSYYVGSLMDKIDDGLADLNRLQVNQAALDPESYRLQREIANLLKPAATAAEESTQTAELDLVNQKWQQHKQRLEQVIGAVADAQKRLSENIDKTGQVLYESLVPLATRRALCQVRPGFLAVFLHDPSLPLELIREGTDLPAAASLSSTGFLTALDPSAAPRPEDEERFDHFWGLRYAVGHLSSVNFYETNLTSNISFFTPRARLHDRVRVLLCSNPTRDLYFSGQEAQAVAELFEKETATIRGHPMQLRVVIGRQRVKPDVVQLNNDGRAKSPTREHLLASLREGFDVIHYSGHAFFDNVLPGRSGLLLKDGVLTAADVRFILDFARTPVIYANACSAGRIKSVSTRFTGLAAAFIRAGAAGYVSPLWSIDDREASSLAAEYYRALLEEHLPIGECLRRAKRAQARTESITWASLVLYGDPTFSIFTGTVDAGG